MVTIEQLQGHLSRFSYKPGWRFQIQPGLYISTANLICMVESVADSRWPWAPHPPSVPLQGYEVFDMIFLGGMTEQEAFAFFDRAVLTALIRRFDQHEMEEWLRFDGQQIVDPHPELKPVTMPAMTFEYTGTGFMDITII